MAKFCGNCGAPTGDTDKVCSQCGTPLSAAAPNGSPSAVVSPAARKKRKKTLCAVLVITGVVIAALLALLVLSQFTGYKGLLRKVLKAYENYDIETLVSASSDIFYQYDDNELFLLLDSSISEQLASDYEDTIGDHMDFFESEVGHNYKLSYETNEIYAMTKRNMEEYLDYIDDYFDVSMIQKIVVADLVVTATQGKNSESMELEVIMSREEDGWKLVELI